MGCLNAKAMLVSGMSASMQMVGSPIYAAAERTGGISVGCGLVCSVNHSNFLNISPEYLFLMEDNSFMGDVLITSNVVWNVD